MGPVVGESTNVQSGRNKGWTAWGYRASHENTPGEIFAPITQVLRVSQVTFFTEMVYGVELDEFNSLPAGALPPCMKTLSTRLLRYAASSTLVPLPPLTLFLYASALSNFWLFNYLTVLVHIKHLCVPSCITGYQAVSHGDLLLKVFSFIHITCMIYKLLNSN